MVYLAKNHVLEAQLEQTDVDVVGKRHRLQVYPIIHRIIWVQVEVKLHDQLIGLDESHPPISLEDNFLERVVGKLDKVDETPSCGVWVKVHPKGALGDVRRHDPSVYVLWSDKKLRVAFFFYGASEGVVWQEVTEHDKV